MVLNASHARPNEDWAAPTRGKEMVGRGRKGEGEDGAVDWFLPSRYVKYRDELEDG